MSDTAIKVENLSKKYIIGAKHEDRLRYAMTSWWRPQQKEEVWALKDVNFEIKKGDIVGVIGRNGAGKSTLLKILSRITKPTTGRVTLDGRVASLLEVGTGFHNELTGRENIFLNGSLLGMTRSEIKSKLDEIIDFSGVERFIDTPVKKYSSGMYVRLAFSVAAHLESEILLVDEVLAVGDYEFQQKCLGKMDDVAQSGRTVLLVSHNLTLIRSISDYLMTIEKGQLKEHIRGNLSLSSLGYFNNINKKIYPENQYVDYIECFVLQNKINIKIKLKYWVISKTPNLGFIIYDEKLTPLFGTNHEAQKNKIDFENLSQNSTLTAVIESPHLRPGKYLASIWLGDGNSDVFSDEYAIAFDVIHENDRFDLRKDILIGPISPTCSFSYI